MTYFNSSDSLCANIVINLSMVHKKVGTKKWKRSGRKKPRAGDVGVEPTNDSIYMTSSTPLRPGSDKYKDSSSKKKRMRLDHLRLAPLPQNPIKFKN